MPRVAHLLSTLGPLGRSPVAPGTVAAAAAGLVGYGVAGAWGTVAMAGLSALTVGAGQWAIRSRGDAADDPRDVVVDEAAGQLVAMLFLPPDMLLTLLAFVLFRVFDIWKPWPARWVEQRGGAWAVMGDDIAAGVMARVGLLIVQVVR